MKLKALLLAFCLTVSTSAYAGNIETNGVTSQEAPVTTLDPVTDALLSIVQSVLALF
ncbi:MAG TPA: hypothetical protein VN256_12950 [Pyrinomonadaceae bacterium]|nr:hypothetical protein [Pyrinomonadaceae bacterium]